MIARHAKETQRAYVERALRAHGRIATYDALYSLTYEDGGKCSITRLAAIIWTLRDEGWEIDTSGGSGETSVYTLRYVHPIAETFVATGAPVVVPQVPVAETLPLTHELPTTAPAWSTAWRCADCGAKPASEPVPLLGDLGRAYCLGCSGSRYFRRAA